MAIKINFVTQFDNRGIKAAQRELAAVGKSISRSLDYAVVGGIAAATTGLVSAVKASSDYLAQMTGVQQVFGDASKAVEDFAKTAAKTAGLSATEALTSAKTFGLFANAAGLSGQASAEFSTKLVQLAGDLGSFNEIPTAQVLADIQSGLQGQAEPLRKYGIFLTDLKLKEEAKNLAIYKGTGALNDQQKMLASYSLIMKSTKVQQGDFAKYSTDLGNSTKTLTSQLADLQVEIGNAVRPAIAELIPQLQALIPLFGQQLKDAVAKVDWKALFKTLMEGITFLITYGPQLIGFITTLWAMTKAFTAIKLALDLITVSMGIFNGVLAVSPVGLAILGIAALAGWYTITTAEINKLKASTDEYGLSLEHTAKLSALAAKLYPKSALAAQNKNQTSAERLAGRRAQVTKETPVSITSPLASLDKLIGEMGDLGSASKTAKDTVAKALKELKKDLKDLSLKPFEATTRNIGQFEQEVIGSFDSITKKIQDGIANKTVAKKGAQALLSYVAVERKALEALAQQRDALVAKRGLAETLIADVKSAITGVGSLAGLLETETKSVTTSVTQIVDGFVVTTKRTVDEVVGGKGVVNRLREVVAKTKAFAAQLTDLKAMGLNPDLFKQIVDAGPDVGSQLAKEILDGGTDSVSALNTTFAELQTVAGQVAEQTAVVMYNNGVDVAGGLVAGLLSQEQALVDAANQLAAAFNAAYQSQIMNLSVPSAPVVAPKTTSKTVINNQTIKLTTTKATKADAQNLIAAQKKFYGSNYAANITGRSIFV